ncbi:D-2-hydroxyacid dehydrogenase [Candidatus Berkiella cookevillensis]|uniref:D-2-hydroxyacid dehydrogenase n=1 Tax=Candidatus Berkiella cookevillensis TaxID=437022 RepID=A0A0Q9YNN7_9GAMM|nr:D-2-hydroxyacid dehydrogenase [Candidatus Berkiella cookevillensis]MCS5709693.1 D-2-hydroxyacid dehydrogenase [Candidatus Berkiella cookevillensis]
MRGIFLDRATIQAAGIDFTAFDNALEHWQHFDTTTSEAQTLARLQDAELVVTNKVPLTRSLLAQNPQLKCICIAATGTDHVDLKAAHELGIFVCNVVNYSTPAVVQHTFGLMISLMSQITRYHTLVFEGEWARAQRFCLDNYSTNELLNKTLGIVGYGAIGKAVAELARAFGMKVMVSEHKNSVSLRSDRVPFTELIRSADILTLHCPLIAQTRDMIGAPELEAMKPSAFLINTSRGGLIDEKALYEALMHGSIQGAALDVLAQEPPSPLLPLLSGQCPNLIITPHVAWNAVESRQRLIDELTYNILAFKEGKQRNKVL